MIRFYQVPHRQHFPTLVQEFIRIILMQENILKSMGNVLSLRGVSTCRYCGNLVIGVLLHENLIGLVNMGLFVPTGQ